MSQLTTAKKLVTGGAGREVLETTAGIGTALLFAFLRRIAKIQADGKRFTTWVSTPGPARRRAVKGANPNDSRRIDGWQSCTAGALNDAERHAPW